MRQVVQTQVGAGQTAPVILDQYIKDFQVTVYCAGSAGPNYSVQYTYDDPFSVAAGNINWFTDSGIPAGTTAALAETTFDNPIKAVRLNVVSGTVSMTVTQSGGPG